MGSQVEVHRSFGKTDVGLRVPVTVVVIRDPGHRQREDVARLPGVRGVIDDEFEIESFTPFERTNTREARHIEHEIPTSGIRDTEGDRTHTAATAARAVLTDADDSVLEVHRIGTGASTQTRRNELWPGILLSEDFEVEAGCGEGRELSAHADIGDLVRLTAVVFSPTPTASGENERKDNGKNGADTLGHAGSPGTGWKDHSSTLARVDVLVYIN